MTAPRLAESETAPSGVGAHRNLPPLPGGEGRGEVGPTSISFPVNVSDSTVLATAVGFVSGRVRLFSCLLVFLLAAVAFAQRRGGGGAFMGGGELMVPESTKTARDVESRTPIETPMWTNAPGFETDAFTFTRLRYDKSPDRSRRGSGGWTTDLPDSDLNLSYRLQQMMSLRVDPNGRLIRPTDVELSDYPFLFAAAPGSLNFTEQEALALRNHLQNGGFLLMADFHGEREWENCTTAMKEVFPNREFFELPLDHPLYHGVFEIKAKVQVPNIRLGIASEQTGVTWEVHDGEECREVHHRAIADDKGRLMVLALHNADMSDGWEREGESDYYFHNFSEKVAYPLGVNIIFYVMTH